MVRALQHHFSPMRSRSQAEKPTHCGVALAGGETKKGVLALCCVEPWIVAIGRWHDPTRPLNFGLIAEEVEKISADLVTRDKDGKPYTVRYGAVNAMLLNKFLKEHRKNEEQQAIIERQQQQIEALTAGLQKVRA
jgi:hypothetical protein